MNRRDFLQSAFYSSLLYGSGSIPGLVSSANAAFEPVVDKLLVNLFLDGGPDIRHFVVPAYDANPDSFGYKYWSNRWRAHQLTSNPNTWQTRWEDDFFKITVGGNNWDGALMSDSGAAAGTGPNQGVTFGIWKEAGWLIDMFLQGKAAIVSNAVGGRNRAHDLSTLMLNQGNVLSRDSNRSGWGGRLARSAGGNSISVTSSPSAFCFGPVGAAPGYDPDAINNIDLISVENSRTLGMFDFDLNEEQLFRTDWKMARALKSYYAGFRQEQFPPVYDKFVEHEAKVRQFGEVIRQRLDFNEPDLIRALYSRDFDRSQTAGPGGDTSPPHNINNDGNGNSRRVLRSSSFGRQVRNLYDVLAASEGGIEARAVSMRYGGWDSHGSQRRAPDITDFASPDIRRGIENGFKDIFGGPFGDAATGLPNALHSGFSALWQSLNQVDREKMVITVAGEFGRQIRDNGDAGTDHGKGNIMFIISEEVTGGVYGEMFQQAEIDKYDDSNLRTPDIDPRTDIDHFLAEVCDWVSPGSGNTVFPRLTDATLPPEDQAELESGVSFGNLFT